MPTLKKESACYILRSCLRKEATDTVKSVDDDIQEMWKWFDEKYGDPAKVADAIINTIQNVRPIKVKLLKETKVELSVTKIGGNNKKIKSNRYKLSLFDKQCQEAHGDVYGIDKITSEIRSVDIDGIVP